MATTLDRICEVPLPARRSRAAVIAGLTPILLYYCTNGFIIPRTDALSLSAGAVTHGNSFLNRGPELAVAMAACCMALFGFRAIVNRLRRVPYLVYSCLLPAISIMWASDWLHCAEASFMLLSLLVIAAYCCGHLRNNDLLCFLTYTGLIAFVLSILLVALVPDIGMDVGQSGAWRGIFGQKNNCGAFSGLFVFSAFSYKGVRLGDRLARFFCLILGATMIGMSQSRTGWLLLGLGAAIIGMVRILKRFKSRDAFTLFISLVTIVVIALSLLFTHLGTVLLLLGKDPTLSQRTIIWRLVWQTVMMHPIVGYGFNSFWQGLQGESANIILVTRWAETQAQNGYLDVWLQLGVTGIILVGLVLLQALNNLRCMWNRASARQLAWCTSVIVAILLYNVGESSLLAPKNLSWFFFVIACISASDLSRTGTVKGLAEHHV